MLSDNIVVIGCNIKVYGDGIQASLLTVKLVVMPQFTVLMAETVNRRGVYDFEFVKGSVLSQLLP